MPKSSFTYETYIRATVKKVWDTFTDPDLMRPCWFGLTQACEWTNGSPWALVTPDGQMVDAGKVLDITPGKEIVISWRHEFTASLKKEGYTRMTLTLEEAEKGATHLKIVHSINKAKSKFIPCVASGWPQVISSFKTFLETGKPLAETRSWGKE